MRPTTFVAIAFVVLPLIATGFDWSLASTAATVVLLLLAGWLVVLRGMLAKPTGSRYVLETITISHFAEKVRWCMDTLGLEYDERPAIGTLGAYYAGRTVPRLLVRTGAVWSSIGNSREILRFLWGEHGSDPRAAFLEPTPERADLEKRLDRAGVMLQLWVYHHLLDHPALTLRAWGIDDPAVPAWQKLIARPLLPVQRFLIRRSFKISTSNYERACHYLEELLSEIDTRLADGRRSILGDDTPNYTDICFAAMMGLWLQPQAYGGPNGRNAQIAASQRPLAMQADVSRWQEDYPRATAFVENLYSGRIMPRDNDTVD